MLQPILQNTMKEASFSLIFDGILFSGPIRLAKPSPKIYSHFLRKFDLKAEECFFIDDLEPNINAAKEAGMGGLVFTGDINE